MSNITIENEQSARAAIAAYIGTLGDVIGNVFDRRRSIKSRQDFFAKLGKTVNNKTEIRFLEIELIDIQDDATEGFDDCPVAVLTYNLHHFHEFADDRSDGSNSAKDFADAQFRLRNGFLSQRDFAAGSGWTAKSEPITPPESEFIQFGNDTFTDVAGHYRDLTLEVRFYNV